MPEALLFAHMDTAMHAIAVVAAILLPLLIFLGWEDRFRAAARRIRRASAVRRQAPG